MLLLLDFSSMLTFLYKNYDNYVVIREIFRISGMKVYLLVHIYRNLRIGIGLHRL
jgi:hypothetical protein